jgi:hypothetical protein
MTTNKAKEGPFADTRAAKFLDKRLAQLAPRKNQQEVAYEAGFERHNFLSMMKMGISKIPLDRVPRLAKALEVDPAHLFRLALDQHFKGDTAQAIASIFGEIVSKNEAEWIAFIREATGDSDVSLTSDARDVVGKALASVYKPAAREAMHT